ncbi:unnamed protein product, partial [Effrenium voratum]
MRSLTRSEDEEAPMLATSIEEEAPRGHGKSMLVMALGAALLLGAVWLLVPMPSLSKPAELQGKTDLWSLSIPQSLKDGMSGALESVKDGMESAHKGVTDQVWQSQHTEMMEKFNKYDVDGDGHICSGELVTWVFGPKNEDDSEVQKSVKCFVEKFGPKSGKLSPQDMYYVFVKKILPFEGVFDLGVTPEPEAQAREELLALLDGYCTEKGPLLVQRMFSGFANRQAAAETVRGMLEKYLSNERPFASSIQKKQPYDKLLLELIGEGKESLEKVLFMMVAHNKLHERSEVLMAILREMVAAEGSGMSCMFVPDMRREGEMDSAVHLKIAELSQLPTSAAAAGDYGNVRYLAQQLLDVVPQESYQDRVRAFREQLEKLTPETMSDEELPGAAEGSLEVELLVEALSDSDARIQRKAMHAYAYWLAAPSRLSKLEVLEGSVKSAVWSQYFPVKQEEVHHRHGQVLVLSRPQLDTLEEKTLGPLVKLQEGEKGSVPLNFLHIVVGRDSFPSLTDRSLFFNSDEELKKVLKQCQDLFSRKAELLKSARRSEGLSHWSERARAG